MTLIYHVQLDTADDGSYATDLVSDVISLWWRLGMQQPSQSIAPLSKAKITLDNIDKKYSPEDVSSNLEIGRKVRIQTTTTGPITTTMLIGVIVNVIVTQENNQHISQVFIEGIERELFFVEVLIAPQVDVLPNTVMALIMAEVGGLTFLGDTGQTRFAYMADNWNEGILAIEGIREAVDADRGSYYSQRNAALRYRRRRFNTTNDTSQHTFNDDMIDIDYSYGHDTVSTVKVTCIPRKQLAAGTIIWTVFNAQRILTGISRRIIATFRDDQENPCGAIVIVTPVATTDYVANTKKDGTGTNVTAFVTVALTSSDFSAATLTVTSTYPETVYMQPGMQLRGTPIYGGVPITVEQTDATAEAAYGKNILHLNLSPVDSIDDANEVAQYELGRRKNPIGNIGSILLDAQDHPIQIARRTMRDRITITETQTDHSDDYFIIGEEHEITLGGAQHQTRWYLEPASISDYWLMDSSKLDDNTRLTYGIF